MTREPSVIVIDDDPLARGSLRALLDSVGIAVREYASAEEFLRDGEPGGGDCLLTDVRMPGMSGLELQARLSARRIGVQVIIMTGYGDVPLAVKAMKAGAFDFIEKPYDSDTLIAAVRRALDAGKTASVKGEQAAAARDKIAMLTAREREVFEKLALGKSNKLAAQELGISPRTVEVHRARVQQKLGAHNLSDLVRISQLAGLP